MVFYYSYSHKVNVFQVTFCKERNANYFFFSLSAEKRRSECHGLLVSNAVFLNYCQFRGGQIRLSLFFLNRSVKDQFSGFYVQPKKFQTCDGAISTMFT